MKKTLDFLKQLKANNTKEWFDAHKPLYLQAKQEFEILVSQVIAGLAKADKAIPPTMKAADCTFRIYKDVRFSKDKTPYKTNMGASINPGGRKSTVAGYYLHIEPGGSFLAGGVYMPDPPMLNAIRQEIDYNPKPLLKIFNAPAFKKYFKGLDEIDKLKTAPKGFDKNHPLMEWLKHKHFIVSYEIPAAQVLDKNAAAHLLNGFKAMMPFIHYLRQAQGAGE